MDLKKYILENWKLKLLSVVLAVMLWFVVFLIGETKKEIRVPISVVNLKRGFVVMRMDMTKVDITLSGRVSVLKDIKENSIGVTLNASNVQEGENIFNISENNIEIPRGVQISGVRPTSITIDVDRIIEKKVKTVVKLDWKKVGEYEIKSWTPEYVMAEGPKGIWEERKFIETVPVNGELKEAEETVTVPLDIEGLQASKIKPDAVKVFLKKYGGRKISREKER